MYGCVAKGSYFSVHNKFSIFAIKYVKKGQNIFYVSLCTTLPYNKQGWELYAALSDFVRCALCFSQFVYIRTALLTNVVSLWLCRINLFNNRRLTVDDSTAYPHVNVFITTCGSLSESKPEPQHTTRHIILSLVIILYTNAGEGWLGFPYLWSGQKPWWNWYLTLVVNFGEVRRTKLAKSTLLTSTLVPLGSFQIF